MNKKAQLQAVTSPPVIFSIVGAILGYIIAGAVGIDRTLGVIGGGLIGFFISTRI
jgi:LytS/YehU family sensor histidine kinase